MVKKPIFLHIRKKVRFFLVLNTFFIIPNITFAESKIYWNAQTDVFSIQSMSTIREVLDCIEANSDYIFVYSDEVNSRLSNKVSISTSDNNIDSVLDELFEKTDLEYKKNGRQIIISAPTPQQRTNNSSKNNIKVTGNVTDEKGEPLIGVTVVLKGDSTVNTITNLDGIYSINVPNRHSELSFSYVGFVPKTIDVDGHSVLNVVMVEDVGQLDEVVVVAYGAQKKESVVGSITTVAPEKLRTGTTRSLSNNLAGVVSGVIGVQRSGEPGYDNSSFWIRGISSFQTGTTDPLVLVDGIERDLNNLNSATLL